MIELPQTTLLATLLFFRLNNKNILSDLPIRIQSNDLLAMTVSLKKSIQAMKKTQNKNKP